MVAGFWFAFYFPTQLPTYASSALDGLNAEFGMGSGVSLAKLAGRITIESLLSI